jgi:hypothetical protein
MLLSPLGKVDALQIKALLLQAVVASGNSMAPFCSPRKWFLDTQVLKGETWCPRQVSGILSISNLSVFSADVGFDSPRLHHL